MKKVVLTDTGENVQKWTRVFSTRRWVILVARTRRKKREENSVSTFGRFRLCTSFESSPVSVKKFWNRTRDIYFPENFRLCLMRYDSLSSRFNFGTNLSFLMRDLKFMLKNIELWSQQGCRHSHDWFGGRGALVDGLVIEVVTNFEDARRLALKSLYLICDKLLVFTWF